jgi:hypothetical protein
MLKIQQISLIAVVAIGIGALLLPGTGLTQAAFANHDKHHDHNNGGTHISIHQSNHQSNECLLAICANVGINNVSIH